MASMLELMTWSEIIENLKVEGQLKMAVIFDMGGAKIAQTSDAELTEDDAISVLDALQTINSSMYGLFLLRSKFICFRVDGDTLIGQADHDVFVAHRNRNLLICALSGPNKTTSCLGTVKNFAGRLVAEGSLDPSVPSLM
ncbi:unnamed protein product [Lymnaea stagnalis]|uniref:Profilin n=1 Tax=Lymnaea stagnalis TaxID=6523 RepID=A0AAV2HHM4_LYMST